VIAALGQRRAELLVPPEHLRGEAHHEQQRGGGRVPEGLVAELDVADAGHGLWHAAQRNDRRRAAWR
jgi:hypothetical protein